MGPARVVLAAAVAAVAAIVLAAPAQAELPRLRVEHGSNDPILDSGIREVPIVDSGNREVLLRGVNVNQLVDYFAWDPSRPTVVPLTRADIEQIAGSGFNAIRLALSWSALEPQRGGFDQGYVARVREVVGWARAAGIYVVLDMHQDAWGKHVDTKPGEVCGPGFEPSIGWDGAPAWATLTDGQSTCRAAGTRELAPAVAQAFTNFYDNREDIQERLAQTWRALAKEFAADTTIAGYDLLNEPHPGLRVGADSSAALGRYYARAIAAIRDGERAAPGGFHHLIVFEPSVTWSGAGTDTIPPNGFTPDDQIVFSPHLYAESITLDRRTGMTATSIEQGWHNARGAANAYNAPLWPGEWGWFGDPKDDLPKVIRYAAQEDRSMVGGAWWVWKQACGDPHVASSPARSVSLHPLDCPGDRGGALTQDFVRVITRAYPRAVPNRLTKIASDPATGRFTFAGVDTRGARCRIEAWIPGPGGPPVVRGTSISELAVARSGTGWLATGCARATYELSGEPGDASGATGPAGATPTPVLARCRARRVVSFRLPRRLRRVRVRVLGARPAVSVRGRRVRLEFKGTRPGHVTVLVTARRADGRRYVERRSVTACATRSGAARR